MPNTALYRLRAAVSRRDSVEACDILITPFASFISLLFTFIGEDLGFRLIDQVWPEVALGETDVHGEEAPQ